ncbi:MAG: hypothetical protein K6G56_06605 [Clostridiales bacterium]|nr:hypothetical protein [Clostridiales bacterium]
MDKQIIELYEKDEPCLLEKRARIWRAVALGVAFLTLTVCVLLVININRFHFNKELAAAIAVCTVGGWTVISLMHFPAGDSHNEARHAKAILEAERETVPGKLTVTDERIYIKKAVTMRKVLVENGEEKKSLWINERKLGAVKGLETKTVYAANGFVAAVEV